MADVKITELPAITTLSNSDVFPVEKVTAPSTTSKIAWSSIKTALINVFVPQNAPITGATKTKITYDSAGLVTDGVDATTADIADSADKRYCTDAQKTVISNTSGTNTGDDTATTIAGKYHALTSESVADGWYFQCLLNATTPKKTPWTSIKAVMKTYMDTLYEPKGAMTDFTPTVTLVGGTGNTVPVYATNSAHYQQIGKLVFVEILLTGDGGAEGAGTGEINVAVPIMGKPTAYEIYKPVGRYSNSTTIGQLLGKVGAGGTTVRLKKMDSATGWSSLNGADQNNATRLIDLSFFYEVS